MAEKMVVLLNKDQRRIFEATMYHAVVCTKDKCYCKHEPARASSPGPGVRVEASFTILPRQHKALPAVVLQIPQVKTAMLGANPWLVEANKLAEIKRFGIE